MRHLPDARTLGALLLAAGLAVGCDGPEDVPSRVHDLRVLALQAEPPEYVMSDEVLLAVFAKALAGIQPDAATVAFIEQQLPTFRVRALVIDPAGGGREVRFRYSTCFRPQEFRCQGNETETILGEGVVTNEEAVVDFKFDFARVAELIANDSLRGLGGVPVLISLHVSAGSEEVYAAKRVVITPPIKSISLDRISELAASGDAPDPAELLAEFEKIKIPNKTANVNPAPPEIQLDGELLAVGDARSIKANPAPTFMAVEPPEEAFEKYVVPTFSGGTTTLTENWRYSWFTTLGYFSPQRTGGIEPNTLEPEPTEAKLNVFPDDPAGEVRIWTVVRDGRGGESWSERRVTFVPGQ